VKKDTGCDDQKNQNTPNPGCPLTLGFLGEGFFFGKQVRGGKFLKNKKKDNPEGRGTVKYVQEDNHNETPGKRKQKILEYRYRK